MTPLVSIPIITYNGERYVRQQLDSIYRQTYPNIEVLAVDDGSTDATVQILEEFRDSHGLKVVVNNQNLGYLRNFEKAVSLCTGEFIAPSDQDDIWLPEKISTLVENIGNNSMVFSELQIMDTSGTMIAESGESYSWIAPCSGKPFFQLLFNPFVVGCTCMFRKSLLKIALPIPEGEVYHDYWFSLVAAIMDGIKYVRKPLIRYRQHGNNTLGLKRRGSFFRFLFNFFEHKPEIKIQADRLAMLEKQPCFNQDQLRYIGIAKTFFEDRLKPGLHIQAFLIALKYAHHVFPQVSLPVRWKAIAGTLFR